MKTAAKISISSWWNKENSEKVLIYLIGFLMTYYNEGVLERTTVLVILRTVSKLCVAACASSCALIARRTVIPICVWSLLAKYFINFYYFLEITNYCVHDRYQEAATEINVFKSRSCPNIFNIK